jgi:hypothetical protein
VWWSGILAPAAAEGGGTRPLGGLEHRAGAACRASEADRSGARDGAGRPTVVLPLGSQDHQYRRNPLVVIRVGGKLASGVSTRRLGSTSTAEPSASKEVSKRRCPMGAGEQAIRRRPGPQHQSCSSHQPGRPHPSIARPRPPGSPRAVDWHAVMSHNTRVSVSATTPAAERRQGCTSRRVVERGPVPSSLHNPVTRRLCDVDFGHGFWRLLGG